MVDRILCPGCGSLIHCVKSNGPDLKGEVSAEARSFVEKKTGRK